MRNPQSEKELIDFSDMSRLRVIAHLKTRGEDELAKEVVEDIDTEPAKKIATVLIDGGTINNPQLMNVAKEIRESVLPKAATSG